MEISAVTLPIAPSFSGALSLAWTARDQESSGRGGSHTASVSPSRPLPERRRFSFGLSDRRAPLTGVGYVRRSSAREHGMAGGKARLPPRWFVVTAWHVHRLIVRASGGARACGG